MNPDPNHYYLLAGYLAAWVIHGTYLALLVGKFRKIRQEMEKLRKGS